MSGPKPYRPFRHGTFRQESFPHRWIITGTFWHCGHSGRWTFQPKIILTWEIFGTGNFRCEEFSAPEHFGTGIFRHLNISAPGYFGTLQSNIDILAQTFRHLCYCAKMSMCQIDPVPKCSWAKNSSCQKSSCQKVPMSKCSRVEMSICWNVCSAEWRTWNNVSVMKHACRNDSCRNVLCRNGL